MKSVFRSATRRLCVAALLSGALLALSACIDLVPEAGEAPRLYTVNAASAFPEGLPQVAKQLVVETPIAPDGLDTQRIAVREAGPAIGYYANARWIAPPPAMLQAALIESFHNSGKVLAVSRRDPDLRADYSLKIELAEFTADLSGGAPLARIRATARLVLVAERQIVASRTFEQSAEASGSAVEAVAAAFDRAAQGLSADIVVWALPAMR